MSEVVPAVPDPAVAEDKVAHASYADVTRRGERKPLVAEPWQRHNIRATIRRLAGLHWHKTRYHAYRSHLYAGRTIRYSVTGAAVLTFRLLRWWHWTPGWVLESVAVAAGRSGHAHAMQAHTEGKKTRSSRGRIIAACAAGVVVAAIAAWHYAPHWTFLAVPLVVVPVLVHHGKPRGRVLAERAVVSPQYEKLTSDIIVRALGSLSLSGINKVISEGREIQFVAPGVHRDGPGWRAELDLPYGVTVQEVMGRRDKLASGLRRPLGCVWPEASEEHAGRLILYVCDQPLSRARQPAWPLARSQADVFAPLPFGTDQRGRLVSLPLMFSNLLIGSIPRQGKTVALRNVLLAAALDPSAELRVFELKGTGDLDMLAPCCHAYGSGADDDTIADALASLRQLAEVELVRRAKMIRELGKDVLPESKVTPEAARRRSLRLHPVVFAIDECQEAFAHPDHGKLFEQYALPVIKRGPALGIMLLLGTQRPDAASLPTGVSANMGLRFCLRVMGQTENDMILGTSQYQNGVRATLMNPSDKGCGYLVGVADHAQVVKSFNINGKQAEAIAVRARAAREAAGTLTGHALGEETGAEPRSFAADVLTVFGADERLWTETIAVRLADLIPDVYADVTATAVASQLRGLGVTVKKVREPGREPRAGCERSAVQEAAGALV